MIYKYILLILFSTHICQSIFSQEIICGHVVDAETHKAIEYVNIGVVGKNIGTVSDSNGYYSISISSQFDPDSIRFSCIGYESRNINIKNLRERVSGDILLSQAQVYLNEIIVTPGKYKEKVLGNTYRTNKIQAGFRENNMGFECGILLPVKKQTILEKLTCNISECTYDSIHYRLNVYKQTGKMLFEPILKKPIYIKQKVLAKSMTLVIDLSEYNLIVRENTLITLEHIEDMGIGHLLFSGGLIGNTCYYRKTSQGKWEKTPLKLGFSVIVKTVE